MGVVRICGKRRGWEGGRERKRDRGGMRAEQREAWREREGEDGGREREEEGRKGGKGGARVRRERGAREFPHVSAVRVNGTLRKQA